MKSKKVAAMLTIILFSFSVSACSSNMEQQRMTESATEESESITEEQTEEETEKETETEKQTESEKETQKETEATKESKDNNKDESTTETKSNESKDNKVTETSKASTTKEDSKPAETTAPQATETPQPVHTHNYNGVVTTQPTCSTPGVKTYTCSSCNDSYTESISCIGHVWQDRYETIHHEAQGEMKQVQVGYSDEVYICNVCGAEFGSASEVVDHCASYVGTDREHATARTIVRGGQPIYESQFEITQEAYDETIVVGQTCVNCGLTRE